MDLEDYQGSKYWLDVRSDRYGTAYFISNIRAGYKPDDLNWQQLSFGQLFVHPYLHNAEVSTTSTRKVVSSVLPWIRIPQYFINCVDTEKKVKYDSLYVPNEVDEVSCAPIWMVLRRTSAGRILLARTDSDSSLTVYQWRRQTLHAQRLLHRPGSPDSSNLVHCNHVWQHPLVIQLRSSNEAQSLNFYLWTINDISNELFCHQGSNYSRSLALPVIDSEPGCITALCIISQSSRFMSKESLNSEPISVDETMYLVVSTRNGDLFTRIGLSPESPIGTSWIMEAKMTSTGGHFCTSLTYFDDQLWATTNLGEIFSSDILWKTLFSSGGQIQNVISPYWTMRAARCVRSPLDVDSTISFYQVSGTPSIGIFAVGSMTSSKVTKSVMCSKSSAIELGNVFALTYATNHMLTTDQATWLHIPAPKAQSIYVTESHIWLLSASRPTQLFVHRLLVNSSQLHCTPPAASFFNLLGSDWQLVPHPDPIRFHMTLANPLAALAQFDLQQGMLNRNLPPIVWAVCHTTGDVLSLSLVCFIKFRQLTAGIP